MTVTLDSKEEMHESSVYSYCTSSFS